MILDNETINYVLDIVQYKSIFNTITKPLYFETKGMHYVFALSKLMDEKNTDKMEEFTKIYEKLQARGKEDEEATNISFWVMKRKDLFGGIDNAINMYEEMEKKDDK